jgi:hypothetical protein
VAEKAFGGELRGEAGALHVNVESFATAIAEGRGLRVDARAAGVADRERGGVEQRAVADAAV